MSSLKVRCYSGYKADQKPVSFEIDIKEFPIETIFDQWCNPEAECFRVLAGNGKVYVLKHILAKDNWELEAG